jgi:hypothetical protein
MLTVLIRLPVRQTALHRHRDGCVDRMGTMRAVPSAFVLARGGA